MRKQKTFSEWQSKFNGTFGEESAAGGTFGDFCEAPPNEVSGATRDRIRRGSGGS
jgi:hypothetical protein